MIKLNILLCMTIGAIYAS